MDHNTNYTDSPEDNKLGLTDFSEINKVEAKGIIEAELLMLEIDSNDEISVDLILRLHKVAFGPLYDWAGKWRKVRVSVGKLELPDPQRIPNLMYQFLDNLNYKIKIARTTADVIGCLAYAHYEFVLIHPFNNGNGRLGRIVINIAALKLGYEPIDLYSREGESRHQYISALKAADDGNIEALQLLIRKELRVL
ncbi:hypothetical protein CHU92_03500 [Flavobacterium cyanobacteriorum]|uniref:Fido domain-containing protein n=1 Tax=Flavobacterium cyanobacteriorum TaxID=2022802 RepID=A0A255ZPM0_9FLAO|nr:Fic family protein [Flavobacterium cyanobacteriorum]OYQ43342.1 hypothetical protein CHU92_03500 [Flavobacterium cyanobacteriorum]